MKLKHNRKFIIAILILSVAALASLFNRLISGDLANVLTAIGVAFMGGNAVEHWSASKQPESKEPEGD